MKRTLKERYENNKIIGIWSQGAVGATIVFYEPDENDKADGVEIISAWQYGNGEKDGFRRHHISYTASGLSYIRKGALKIRFCDVMRI